MFITLEGSEGSGKTTQQKLLAEYIEELGFPVLMTREPGGTMIGEQVRQCLHDVANKTMTAEAEVLLYSASRAQLVQEIIKPALARNFVVIGDRFADSTLAYQGYGRQLDLDTLIRITHFATGGLKPDLTLLLDMEVNLGLARRTVGENEINRMDMQVLAFYERVRQGYYQLVTREPERWVIVDANRPVDEVQADLRRQVKSRLMPV